MTRINYIFFLCLFSTPYLLSQRSIEGSVRDADSLEPIIFGTVKIYKNELLITESETDFDGYYTLKDLTKGKYQVLFTYLGYRDIKVLEVKVKKRKTTRLDVNIAQNLSDGKKQMIVYNKRIIDENSPCCIFVTNKSKPRKQLELRTNMKY